MFSDSNSLFGGTYGVVVGTFVVLSILQAFERLMSLMEIQESSVIYTASFKLLFCTVAEYCFHCPA